MAEAAGRGRLAGAARGLLALTAILVVLPTATATAADRSGTVTATTPFEWDGQAAVGSNTTYNAQTGEPCPQAPPRTPENQCDVTLLEIDSAAFGGLRVSIDEIDTRPTPTDFDLYVYESDAAGTRGDLLAASAGITGSESVAIETATGFFLVQVVYYDVQDEGYHGRAEIVRRDRFPRDVDIPPGLQDVLASDPARGFRSHSEPHIAQSPTNPDLLVAASKMYNLDEDSLAEYEFKIGTYVSFDRGQSWSDLGQLQVCAPETAPPASWPGNTCYPNENPLLGGTGPEDADDPRGTGDFGEEYITSDVWVQFDDDGTAYAMVLDSPPFRGGAGWGMTLHRWETPSPADVTAGSTWSPRIPINSYPEAASDPGFGTLDDKNTFAVNNAGPDDDGQPGPMVACWTRNNGDPNRPPQEIVCERSTNGGRTWPGTPQPISGNQLLEIGVHVLADPRDENTFYATWLHYLPGALGLGLPDEMSFSKSTDGGVTWSRPRVVAQLTGLPNTFPGQAFRNLSIPSTAAGPRGELYLVYSDYREAPQPEDEDEMQADVMLVRSPDRGDSWFAPVKVNQDTTNADQFQPMAAVNAGGQVNVLYFDRRLDPPRVEGSTVAHPGNFFIDQFLSRSNDGGRTFTDVRVSHDAWDPTINPPISPSGQFIGDYQGLVADCDGATPFVNDTHLANDPGRDPAFDIGEPRSVFQEVFSWRVPNTPQFGGAPCRRTPPRVTGAPPHRDEQQSAQRSRSRLVVLRRRTRLSSTGRAPVALRCSSTSRCEGTLRLFRFVVRGDRPVARIPLGRRAFRIAAGRTATVRVQLPRAQRRVVARRGQVRMIVSAQARFGDGTQGRAYTSVPLLRPRR